MEWRSITRERRSSITSEYHSNQSEPARSDGPKGRLRPLGTEVASAASGARTGRLRASGSDEVPSERDAPDGAVDGVQGMGRHG